MPDFIAYYREHRPAGSQRLRTGSATRRRASPYRPRPARRRIHGGGERQKHTNCPQLLAALQECRKKATLVIAKLDRLGRNVAFISALMDSGADFVCCDNPHANRLMLHMLAAFAEHEREQISHRTKAALAAAKAGA